MQRLSKRKDNKTIERRYGESGIPFKLEARNRYPINYNKKFQDGEINFTLEIID